MTASGGWRPAPEADPITRPFWEAAERGELVVQRCSSCDRWIHYPRVVCPGCSGSTLTFEPVSGDGTLYSWSWAHRPAGRAFAERAPHLVAMVELEQGVRMMTTLDDVDPEHLTVGAPVRLSRFEKTAEDGPPVPIFRLA